MKCPRCQHENEAGAKFCEECAAPLARVCANCGRQLSPAAKFCPECAHPTGLASATPIDRRFGSPESYTPKHLAEKILTSKAALAGERKQVTVLFADLKGSMELLADRDPEEARKILDPVLELMMEAVHRYEGTVNQVMGDGIMALFGAPLAHEDHAVRACYAVLRMQESVKRLAAELRRTAGVPPAIRVGLNSGEVVVRSIGNDLHMDYTAVGQTTHLAARMEQAALPGTIVITADTLRLAEGFVEVRSLGVMPIKGMTEPVEAYELIGAGQARTRFQAAATRGLTRFVGRDTEIDQLQRGLERAAAGRGQVVAVVGEAGVGKSRLFYEFTHSHRVQGWLIVESGSVSYGKSTTYLAVIDLLKSYFKIDNRDDQRQVRDKVIGRVLGLDRSLEPQLTPILALLDVPVDDPGWEALDPPQRRQRTHEAVKRLLLRESQVQPLLIVIEDLHWIDSETQALLDTVADSLGSIRALLLVNYRPEYDNRWGKKTYHTQIRLQSLPPESTNELLRALLGDAPGLEPLEEMLRRRGNPFFLEETIRTLVETGALEGARGAYRLVRPVHSLQIPATVQATLAARIDRLSPDQKHLLQTASVIGKDVPSALLIALSELPEESLRRTLGHLQDSEFLYETTLFPDVEYTFKHALTHEVTYGSLLHDRRRTVHGQIVYIIERLYPDRLPEQVDRLAHHAFRGEVWDKAVTYLHQAGGKAAAHSSNQEAVGYFEQALTALTHLPETRQTLEQAVDLRFDLRHAQQVLGEMHQGIEHLRQAETLARALGDKRRLGLVYAYRCWSTWMIGHTNEAVALGRSAHAIAETAGDLTLTVTANYCLGSACFLSGDYPGAVSFHRRIVESLEGDLARQRLIPTGYPAVISRAWLAWALAQCGRFDEGLREGEAGLRLAATLGHPFTLVWPRYGLANILLLRGESGAAVTLLKEAMALADEWQLGVWHAYLPWCLGRAYVLSGRVAEGLALLRQSLEFFDATKLGNWESLVIADLSQALLLDGRLDEAFAEGRRALALARQRGERGHEAWALHLLGEVATRRDPPEHADGHYRDALTLAEELGMRPLVAHCHLGLGKLYRRMGKRKEAPEHLVTATTMYREMDMRFWLEQAEAEMRELEST